MINGEKYAVPMSVEEPSVIAASMSNKNFLDNLLASSIAKLIALYGGGFKTYS